MDGRLNRGVLCAVLVAVFIGLGAVSAYPHPGRLDHKGCHIAARTWKSRDGQRTYKKGTRHCHSVSDGVTLGTDDIRVQED
jgi:hypothetical protein